MHNVHNYIAMLRMHARTRAHTHTHIHTTRSNNNLRTMAVTVMGTLQLSTKYFISSIFPAAAAK